MKAAYDEQAIWGIGETSFDAMTEAQQWRKSGTISLKTAEMTPELQEIVSTTGGDTEFGLLPDGMLGTGAQEYDAA